MASVVSRPRRDGTTAYKVQWRLAETRDGAWQSETFDQRREALKFRALVDAHNGLWPDGWVKGWGFQTPPAVPTSTQTGLLDFGTAYVHRLTSTGPYTQTRYLAMIQRLVGWITTATSSEPLVETFTADDDRAWINARRRAGASAKTIANYHGLLAGIFKDALAKGLVNKNPCEGVRLPVHELGEAEGEGEKMFLTEDEFAMVRDCMHPDSRGLITVAVGTGLRWGELTALRVEDIVLTGSVPHLLVRRAWKRNGSGAFAMEGQDGFYLGNPKTRESRRRVSLAPPVAAALRELSRGKEPEGLVFSRPDGSRLSQSHWYRHRWQVAVKKARLAGLGCSPRFHDLRHTHAAWLISAGVPLPVIQKRLGHKSIKITVDVYGGLLVQTHEVADLAMTRALSGLRIAAPGLALIDDVSSA